jgi:hypothetical protein
MTRPTRLLALLILLPACLPSAGHVEIFGDARGGDLYAEAAPPKPDGPVTPPPDGVGKIDRSVKPDSPPAATCPAPFGSTVGVTVADVTGLPDCADKLYSLHSYCGKKRGVLIAMMSPT